MSVTNSFLLAGFVFHFSRVLGFHKRFQVVQACGPEDSVLLDPGINGAKRFRIQLVNAIPSFSVLTDQMRTPQQTQVLRYRWARDWEGAGDLSRGLCSAAQKVENCSACRIGQSVEGGLVVPSFGICNRSVTHNM